jgi:predicted nucleic acid-binding protein
VPAKLLISDANVIIDMEVGGLIKQMFRLNYEFAVPDVLYETELKENHSNLPKLGLKRIELQPAAVEDAVALGAKYPRPGRIDLMALALARQEKCPLLTGDQKLREAGNAEGVTVVGTIWLIGEMLAAKAVTKKDARTAYSKMKESDRRLPWAEVEKQLK